MDKEITETLKTPNTLMVGVVTRGQGSRMMNLLRRRGAHYAVCTFAEGTVPGHILKMLQLAKTKKELVLAFINDEIEDNCYRGLSMDLKIEQPGHGVAFSIPLCGNPTAPEKTELSGALIIVDKGKGEDVLDVFDDLGLRGGTMLSAYGGASIAKILFDMPVQPEKEVVFLVTPSEKIKEMLTSLETELQMSEPNQGNAVTFAISRSIGLFTEAKKGS
ncbi:MAG: hypothetical protein GX853_04850 [Chloroflexi bacterium]|nr:hypothetical protein [Chloroflexota bacterium]